MITKHTSFYNKKHQDTHVHNFTTQFTELTYRFKDLLPNCIVTITGNAFSVTVY